MKGLWPKLVHWFPHLRKDRELPPGTYDVTIEDMTELTHKDGTPLMVIEFGNVKKREGDGK